MVILPQDASVKRPLRIALTVLSCALYLLPFLGSDPSSVNYTGLFALRPWLTLSCLLPGLLLMSVRFYRTAARFLSVSRARRILLGLLVMTAVLLLIPYHMQEDFWSGLHVFWAWLTFGALNAALFLLSPYDPGAYRFYIAALAASFFITLGALSVNGYAELVFAFGLSIYLHCVSETKEKSESEDPLHETI